MAGKGCLRQTLHFLAICIACDDFHISFYFTSHFFLDSLLRCDLRDPRDSQLAGLGETSATFGCN